MDYLIEKYLLLYRFASRGKISCLVFLYINSKKKNVAKNNFLSLKKEPIFVMHKIYIS